MLCRNPSKRAPVDDTDRRFWLKLFSDRAIAEMAINIAGEDEENMAAALAEVRAWRDFLLPTSRGQAA
jgi:hypothetical protein